MTSSVSSSSGESVRSDQRRLRHKFFRDWIRLSRKLRQSLTQDPNFHLVKVVHGTRRIDEGRKEIHSLTVVTPASDPTVAKDVNQNGWRCVSHLWGDPSEWIVWDDAGVVDGNTGELIKAKVHPGKRDQIMTLLQQRSGYWWIDIFCARSNTPLGIMGNIYKLCLWSVGLIDRLHVAFDRTLSNVFTDAVRLSIIHLDQAADGYLDMINKTHHKENVSADWTQVLKDLLHWSSTHSDEVVNLRFMLWRDHYSETPRVQQFLDSLMQHPVDERIATAQKFFNSKEYEPMDFSFTYREFIKALQIYTPETFTRAQQHAVEFLNCRWMNRVWTLQELALPRLTAVFSGGSKTYTFAAWMLHLTGLLRVTAKAYQIRETTSMGSQSNREGGSVSQTPRQVLNYYQQTDPVLARIYSDYRKVLEVAIAMGYTSGHRSNEDTNDNLGRRILLNSLATSQRKALYPEDYVYGVLGILDIHIPRLEDRDEIWPIFSENLRERYPDIHVPGDVSLDKATKMEDVYGGFAFPSGWDLSSEVVDYLCNSIS